MILNFQVKNWSCYRGETCLSLQAGPERDVANRLPRFGSASRFEKVLPVAAIYGGNASGKTQLVKAIEFLQRFAINSFPKGVLPYEPFLLDAASPNLPTDITIQFLVEHTVFEYAVSLSQMKVVHEELAYYTARGANRISLFVRDGQKAALGDSWGTPAFQAYAAQLTLPEGMAFLALSHELCAESVIVEHVYRWFAGSLLVISPNTHYLGVEDFCSEGKLAEMTVAYLQKFDTGIKMLEPRRVELSTLPTPVVQDLSNNVRVGQVVRVQVADGEIFTVKRLTTGVLEVRRIYATHRMTTGGDIPFSMASESDGTRRMLDLIPAFAQLKSPGSRAVYVIDEIDRSLHYLVSRALVDEFIASCTGGTRSQLIFTTHDLLLMDQKLLRRDEMYVVDKSPDGESSLTDLRQFRGVRKDTDVRTRYLEGRFGGIPSNLRIVE